MVAENKTISINYQGHSLEIKMKYITKYADLKFGGKTLHQILFEYLVRGKEVSPARLVRQLKQVHQRQRPHLIKGLKISDMTVKNSMEKIEKALVKSRDPKLKRLKFVRAGHGGASPVESRNSSKSRLTQAQKEVIASTIVSCLGRKHCSIKELREAALKNLRQRKLHERVLLDYGTMGRILKSVFQSRSELRKRLIRSNLPLHVKLLAEETIARELRAGPRCLTELQRAIREEMTKRAVQSHRTFSEATVKRLVNQVRGTTSGLHPFVYGRGRKPRPRRLRG